MPDAVLDYIQELLEDVPEGSEEDSLDVLIFCDEDFVEYQFDSSK